MIATAVDATYHLEVENEQGVVLVLFSSPENARSRRMEAVLTNLHETVSMARRKLKVVKINADENVDTAARLHVVDVPAMLLYSDGRELARSSRSMSLQEVMVWVKSTVWG